MATITEKKLAYLQGTKDAIKNAIIAKGQAVSDTDTFRSYADKIAAISGETAVLMLQEKIITENGEYTPDDGYDGLSKVVVNVPGEVVEIYDGTVTIE